MSSSDTLGTPVGLFTVTSDGQSITRVARCSAPPPSLANEQTRDSLLVEAIQQLRAYFNGSLTRSGGCWSSRAPYRLPCSKESSHRS